MATVPIADSDEEGPGSPKVAKVEKRAPPQSQNSGGVTLADLQRLLEQQSATLAKSQASEIRSAIKELKQATTAELRESRTR